MTAAFVLDTHELGRQPGAEREFELTETAPESLRLDVIGVPEGADVHVSGRLEAVMEGVLASGTIEVPIHGECVRCLSAIDYDFDAPFSELFVYSDQPADEDDLQLVGDLLDLEPVIRDAVLLELPTNPICRFDCRGLCPQCGINLNEHPDHVHEAPIDPRWAALQDLKEDDER